MPNRSNLQEAMFKAKVEAENRRRERVDIAVSKICIGYAKALTKPLTDPLMPKKSYKHYINMSEDLAFYNENMNEIMHRLRKGLPRCSVTKVDMTDSSIQVFRANKNVCIVIDEYLDKKIEPRFPPIFDKDRMRHSVGDNVSVVGYSQVHTITGVTSVGYSTRYTEFYEGRAVEMTVSHVPFALVM